MSSDGSPVSSPSRPRVGLAPVFVLAAIAAAVAVASSWRLADEREIDLAVECIGQRCEVTVNRQPRLAFDMPAPDGRSLGFYQWHRPASGRAATVFRDLHIERLDAPRQTLDLSLTDPGHLQRFDWTAPGGHPTDGDVPGIWLAEPGRGLASLATRPGMAIALLKDFPAGDFRMSAKVVSPLDAGFVFRARDLQNGMVFVVRPPCNDMFFFRLENGAAGPIQELRPFRDLHVGFESLRLGGLLASILLRTCLLIIVFELAARRIAWLRRPWPVRLSRLKPSALVAGLAVFAGTAAALAWVAVSSLDRIPHITDEVAYLFQARIFAAGRLWAEVPKLPEFFTHYHLMTEGGRWSSGSTPPMFSALLAAGVRAGAPWLVNPLLGGALAVALVTLAREISGPRCARLSWVLIVTSPFFLFMGASMMSHMAAALFVCLCLLLTIRGLRRQGGAALFLAGLSWAAALLTRPFTAAVVLVPLVLYVAHAWWKSGDRKATVRLLAAWPMGAFPLVVAFAGWMILYSSAQGAPMIPNVGYASTDGLGFGQDRGEGWLMTWGSWGHTPAKAVRSVFAYLEDCSHYLQGWPLGLSLAFVAVPLFRRRRPAAEVVLLYGVFLALVVGHMFYWATQHLGYGARYWFSGIPGLVILSAMGIESLAPEADPAPPPGAGQPAPSVGTVLAGVLVGLLILWNVAVYLPPHLLEGHTYGGATVALERETEQRGLTNAVIFVKTENSVYNDGFYLNDPFLKSGPVFAVDLGTNNAALLELYPRSPAYTWDKKMLKPVGTPP